MPRRRPAQVRDQQRRARHTQVGYRPRPHSSITGPLRAAIRRQERWAGETDDLLRNWERLAARREYWYDLNEGCGIPECCGPTAWEREDLERITRRLPPKPAKDFRHTLRKIDERILVYRIGEHDWRDGWWQDA